MTYKKRVVPLRSSPSAVLSFGLASHRYVDFIGAIEGGVAQLRQHLAWLGSPEGVRGQLKRVRDDLPGSVLLFEKTG